MGKYTVSDVPNHQPVSHDLVTRQCASHVAPGTDASHPSAVVSPAPAVTGGMVTIPITMVIGGW